MEPLMIPRVFFRKRCFVSRLFARGIAILLLVVVSSNNSVEAQGLPINRDGVTYDSHPAAAVAADGSTWIAWHAYHKGQDQIIARRISSNNKPGELFTVSEAGKTHSPPVIVSEADTIWVIWSAQTDGNWVVMARRFANGSWQPAAIVSKAGTDAIYPAAAEVQDDKLLVSWSGYESGQFRIETRMFDGGSWQPSTVVSSGRHDAYRPQIAVMPGGIAWVVWDEYTGSHYTVQGRSVLPKMTEIEAISPSGEHCLNPTALATQSGLIVAWLRKVDVVGGPGVISQLHTLNAARRTSAGWKHITDANGSRVAAELTHGLMAKIAPKPVATGGYLGRRTQPMLIETNGSVWLLWERKSNHKGSTPNVSGELIGRSVQDGRWQKLVTIHHGLVDYRLIDPPRSASSQFSMLASQLPQFATQRRARRRIYHRIRCDLSNVDDFQQDEWAGWSPVVLPVADETTERYELKIGGKTFKLYWADLHCHNGLTADAEGEPDELMHYARDRALLDVVVFTNNDFIYDVPLTQYEFALSNFFAKINRQSDFLALPGFEWTSRIPGVPGARVSDPDNWTHPYKNKSYPNHRSVIYPPGGGPLLHYPEVANNIATLSEAVARAGGVTLTQHDAFQVSGHSVEVAMELTSGWRRYIARRPNLFHEPLNKGLRLGFVACGDTHRRAPGLSGALTGIYAEELTSESILNALRARRCFATSGSRIVLDSRVNDSFMGRDVKAADGRTELNLQIRGTRPILSATLIRDGRELKSFSGNGRRTLSLTYSEKNLSSGTHWYYWRVAMTPETPDLPGNLNPAFGHLAWSSPHWVVVE
jgi:hypothetical protein